jgi:polyisoprenoid-binding protein YceI
MLSLIHDPLHSQIEFKIKHLMISLVRGCFEKFDVRIQTKGHSFASAKIFCKIDVSSVNTNIKDRDEHLRSPDFFDVEKYPQMIFRSDKTKQVSKDKYLVEGFLSIKNTSRPVTLAVNYNGSDVDQYGRVKYGFEITCEIDRKDWKLNFNVPGGQSTLLIGDRVRIEADIQMMKDK